MRTEPVSSFVNKCLFAVFVGNQDLEINCLHFKLRNLLNKFNSHWERIAEVGSVRSSCANGWHQVCT
jgi:hypothetical protein